MGDSRSCGQASNYSSEQIKKVCFNLILDIPTTPSDLSDLIEKATWKPKRDGLCTFVYNDSCEFGRIAPNDMSRQTHRLTVLVHILQKSMQLAINLLYKPSQHQGS